MKILAHRGLWSNATEKNSLGSLKNALILGFGIETDVRDFNGNLVISHDVPCGNVFLFEEILSQVDCANSSHILAINVKSDGIQSLLLELLKKYNISNYFVFDMSIPELIKYQEFNFNFFCRLSEYEVVVPEIKSKGYWVDGFHSNFDGFETLKNLLDKGKKIAIVSPELHSREYIEYWYSVKQWLITLPSSQCDSVMLCTDFPLLAMEYFNVKN